MASVLSYVFNVKCLHGSLTNCYCTENMEIFTPLGHVIPTINRKIFYSIISYESLFKCLVYDVSKRSKIGLRLMLLFWLTWSFSWEI
jgi:hypothetical protein